MAADIPDARQGQILVQLAGSDCSVIFLFERDLFGASVVTFLIAL
jgi:hypothetical protein